MSTAVLKILTKYVYLVMVTDQDEGFRGWRQCLSMLCERDAEFREILSSRLFMYQSHDPALGLDFP